MTDRQRREFLDAAADVFAEYGWRDVAVDLLCETMGSSLVTFYDTFESIDGLFAEMYRLHSDEALSTLRRSIAGSGHGGNSIDAMTAHLSTHLDPTVEERRWWLLTTEYALRSVRYPEVARDYLAARTRFREGLALILTDLLPGVSTVAPAVLAELLTMLHRGSMSHHLLSSNDDGTRQAAQLLIAEWLVETVTP